MEVLNQLRTYILIFIFFNLWTSFEHFKYKRLLCVYSVFAFISTLLLFALSMYYTQFYSFTSLSNTVTNVIYTLIWMVHLLIVFESMLESNTQKQLIEKFNHIDELFRFNLNTKIAYHAEKSDLLLKNLLLSVCIVPIYIAITVYLFWQSQTFNTMYLSTFSFYIIRMRVSQTLLFVILLRNRLILINDKLKFISKVVRTPNNEALQPQRRLVSIFSCSSLNFPKSVALLSLKQIYQELHDICGLINSAFGSSLLGILTQNFVDLITNSYWAYLLRNDINNFFIFAGLLFPNLSVLAFFCFYCSSCYSEVGSICRSRREQVRWIFCVYCRANELREIFIGCYTMRRTARKAILFVSLPCRRVMNVFTYPHVDFFASIYNYWDR